MRFLLSIAIVVTNLSQVCWCDALSPGDNAACCLAGSVLDRQSEAAMNSGGGPEVCLCAANNVVVDSIRVIPDGNTNVDSELHSQLFPAPQTDFLQAAHIAGPIVIGYRLRPVPLLI